MPTWLIESIQHRGLVPRRIIGLLALALLIWAAPLGSLFGQSDNASSPALFSNLNGGFGMLYGGFGGNLEVGVGHFSLSLSSGYATQRTIDNVVIKPTVNISGGLRYYFNINNDALYPRIGIGYGWITNYYNDLIGTTPYDQSVYSLMVHLGTQFYTNEGVVFNFDIGIGSRYTLLEPDRHPHFYTVYIRPNIGIGYDLTRLFTKGDQSRSIKNRTIDPFGGG